MAFAGCLQGLFCGLLQGATGNVRERVGDSYYLVDWDEHDEASREDWCCSCLIPLDDPKALTIDELAKNIGWKLPAKEPA